jgi:hypothetical protein
VSVFAIVSATLLFAVGAAGGGATSLSGAGNASGGTLMSGTYHLVAVVTAGGGGTYPAKLVLKVEGGSVTGESYWSCCPGPRTDPITGSTGGGKVTLVRNCSGQGQSSCARQVYTGTIGANGKVTGTWESNDNFLGDWTMTGRVVEASLSVAVALAQPRAALGDEVGVTVRVAATGGDVSGVSLEFRPSSDAVVVSQAPPGLAGFDLVAHTSRSFVFKVKGAKAGKVTLSASATAMSASGPVRGTGHAELQVAGDKVSGDVSRVVCTTTECEQKPPFGSVKVVATSGRNSEDGTTDPEGRYTIDGLEPGTWRIAPAVDGKNQISTPVFRNVTFTEGVTGSQAGVNFDVCYAAPSSPSSADGCPPVFDYTMPERFPESAQTKDYAQPESYTVTFTVRNGACDHDSSYDWFVASKAVFAHRDSPCVFSIEFDKLGTYSVRDEEHDSRGHPGTSFIKEVVVQDFLDVAIGDSLASGEGNPPYTTSFGCDDSRAAYGTQAAKQLEGGDLRSSVTFLQLACTGATMTPKSINLTPIGELQRGTKADSIDDQLVQLKKLVGDRPIDALTISIGINDANVQVGTTNFGFVSIVGLCTATIRCQDKCIESIPACLRNKNAETLGESMPDAISELAPLYAQLDEDLKKLFPEPQLRADDVYVVGYPNPLHDEHGDLCSVLIPGPGSEAFQNKDDEGEVTWFDKSFMQPLQRAEDNAVSRFGWHYIDSNSAFNQHGYCSANPWFVHIGEVLAGTKNISGALHPTAAGQATLADLLYGELSPRLLSGGHARKPA